MASQDALRDALQAFNDASGIQTCVPATATEVFKITEEANTKLQGSSPNPVKFSKKLYSCLESISRFTSICDNFIQSDPTITSLIWGCLKFLLQGAIQFTNYLEKLGDMFQEFGPFFPVVSGYESVFETSDIVRGAVIFLYADIVRFCARAVEVLKNNPRTLILSTLFKPFERDYLQILSSYRAHRDELLAAAFLAVQQNAKQERSLADAARVAAEKDRQAARKERKAAEKEREKAERAKEELRIEIERHEKERLEASSERVAANEATDSEDKLRSRKRPRYDGFASLQSSQSNSSMTDPAPECSVSPIGIAQREVPPLHLPRDFSTPLSSSGRAPIPVPSSLETISDVVPSPNEPLQIPRASPEAEKTRRNEILRAWNFLNNTRSKQGVFYHLGPPPSWPVESGGGLQESSSNMKDPVLEKYTDQDMKTDNHASTTIHNGNGHTSQETGTQNNPSSTMEFDNDATDAGIFGESQNSDTLSVASSEFASQEQGIEGTTGPASSGPDNNGNTACPQGQDPVAHPSLNQSSSSRNRKAAYIAARADSYDAWASMSLVSAGNNHTEEEIEL
ncbi:uncharacterized protein ATNIH1004_011255 [Aspergillus tanneri]|uniref:DUF7708 domain-containing protein n=1 Tax=Aspergillus tanneri TaxID=1220188 RepID=A0A5M9MBK0_9EURO|nr:uncharacterized protein ATNIH1004_011255 [Aspergillus tanneri]KAA8642313.1 hypothetical protein ATNIH1004_011255 [Aspergillus tanneri]